MTTHVVNLGYTTGQVLVAQLFVIDSDTIAYTSITVTEATNRKGRYDFTFNNVTAGDYLLIYFIDSIAAGSEYITFLGIDEEIVKPWSEAPIQSFPANFAALGINSSGHISRVALVDTTTQNTDMRGTDYAIRTNMPYTHTNNTTFISTSVTITET